MCWMAVCATRMPLRDAIGAIDASGRASSRSSSASKALPSDLRYGGLCVPASTSCIRRRVIETMTSFVTVTGEVNRLLSSHEGSLAASSKWTSVPSPTPRSAASERTRAE